MQFNSFLNFFLVFVFLSNSCFGVTSLENITAINNTYTKEYCHQLELAYGDNMMSEGGSKGIEKMFQGVDLQGKTLLDFGSGLGGVAVYLASRHQARVTGVEINKPMIEEANKRLPAGLKDKVSYNHISSDLKLSFPENSFDVVYSKGVIVHLSQEQRNTIFKEFHRILKKGGKVIIYDWLSPTDGQWSPQVEKLIETEALPLFAFSKDAYKKQLESVGFQDCCLTDMTSLYAQHNQDVVDRLGSKPIKRKFIEAYGEKVFYEHLEGYQNIVTAHKSGDLLNVRIAAVKE